LRLLEQGRLDLGSLITHRYRLRQYQQAMLTAHQKAKYKAIKVVFDFSA
jgi:threonine dehydrogenase-like Zn-dependent dehydrogenase